MFLAFAMIFTLIPTPAFAASALALTAESIEADLKAGTEISVPVRAANNPGYAAGTVDIKWDNTVLELSSVDYSELAPENSAAAVSSTGKYRVSFGSYLTKENYSETGTFFTLNFTVTDSAKAGDYAIELSNASIYDVELNAVPTVLTNAYVKLGDSEASDALKLEVQGEKANIQPDASIVLPVKATGNPGFAAGKIDLIWDSSALTLTKVIFTESCKDNNSAEIVSDGNYTISFGDYLAKENITETGVLFSLAFDVNENAKPGTYEIYLGNAEAYTADLEKVAVTVKSANVELLGSETSTSETTP